MSLGSSVTAGRSELSYAGAMMHAQQLPLFSPQLQRGFQHRSPSLRYRPQIELLRRRLTAVLGELAAAERALAADASEETLAVLDRCCLAASELIVILRDRGYRVDSLSLTTPGFILREARVRR